MELHNKCNFKINVIVNIADFLVVIEKTKITPNMPYLNPFVLQ